MEKFIEICAFDLLCRHFKDTKGYIVFFVTGKDDGCETYTIFHYDTEEDFRRDFKTKKHVCYPGDEIIPLNITESDSASITFEANGETVELYDAEGYLIIDGKLITAY